MPRLNQIIADYFAGYDEGRSPKRETVLQDHPQFAAALNEFFEELDRLESFYSSANTSSADLAQNIDNSHFRFAVHVDSENLKRVRNYLIKYRTAFTPTGPKSAVGAASVRIGSYKLLQQLGEGGMGQVWMAEQEQPIRRRVAIKLIKAGMDSSQVVARFEAERQALALMDHQNIAKVLDAGTTDSQQPFFVMELVQGIPLTTYCDQNRLSIQERLNLFIPVCHAVQHAHQKGIVHRDLKPSNILVTLYDGRPVPKVIDFGLAKALQHQVKLTDRTLFTEFGQIVGTLRYMSPEQAEMNALDVDTRTDIYSLGVVLYELLTGFTPLGSQDLIDQAILKVLQSIRETDPLRPSKRLSESGDAIQGISKQRQIEARTLSKILKGDLDWIVMKALEKDRARRYSTANDFAEDVSRFLSGDAVDARPPSLDYRVSKFVIKHRSLVVTSMVAVGFLLMATLVSVFFGISAEKARRRAEVAGQRADIARRSAVSEAERAVKAEEIAKHETARAAVAKAETVATLAKSNFFLAQSRWRDGRVQDATRLLHSIPPQHRHEEWQLSRRLFEGSDLTLYGPSSVSSHLAFSPDGAQIACLDSNDEGNSVGLWRWNATTGMQLGRLESQHKSTRCSALARSKPLAVIAHHDGSIQLWDLRTNSVELFSGEHKIPMLIEISPDASQVATYAFHKEVKIWDCASKKLLATLPAFPEELVYLAFHPNGKHLLTVSESGAIQLWNLSSFQLARVVETNKPTLGACVSSDGLRVATVGYRESIEVWNLETGKELVSLKSNSIVQTMSFNPASTQLASGSSDGSIKIWDLTNGQELYAFIGHASDISEMVFSPDGSRLASSAFGDSVKLWDLRSGKQRVGLHAASASIHDVGFNHDGTQVAVPSFGKVSVWDTKSLKSIREIEFKESHEQILRVRFTPERNHLIVVGARGEVSRWDLANGEKSGELELGYVPVLCDLSPSGKRVVAVNDEGRMEVRSFPAGVVEQTIQTPVPSQGMFFDMRFSGMQRMAVSETQLLLNGGDGLSIWDMNLGKLLRQLPNNELSVFGAISLSTDTKFVFVWDAFQRLVVREVETGRVANHFDTPHDGVTAVFPLANASRFVTLSGGYLYWWDTTSREEMLSMKTESSDLLTTLAISRDGLQVAEVDKSTNVLGLWHAAQSPAPLQLFGHTIGPQRVAFGEDGVLYSEAKGSQVDEKFCWDLTSLEYTAVESFPPGLHFAPDVQYGSKLACVQNESVVVVDSADIMDERVQAYRRAKAVFDADWHRRAADAAHARGDWYAGAIHSAWLLSFDPEDRASHYLLRKHVESWERDRKSDSNLELATDLLNVELVGSVLRLVPKVAREDLELEMVSRLEEVLEQSIENALASPTPGNSKAFALTELDLEYAGLLDYSMVPQRLFIAMGQFDRAFECLINDTFLDMKPTTIAEQYELHEQVEAFAMRVLQQLARQSPEKNADWRDVEVLVPLKLAKALQEPWNNDVSKQDASQIVRTIWRRIDATNMNTEFEFTSPFENVARESFLTRGRSLFELAELAARQQPSAATLGALGAVHVCRREYSQAINALDQALQFERVTPDQEQDKVAATALLALSHLRLGNSDLGDRFYQQFENSSQVLDRSSGVKIDLSRNADLRFIRDYTNEAFRKR